MRNIVPGQILKIPGNGMYIIADIHGADCKNHLPKAADGAVVDAIHTGPAKNLGPSGGTEIRNESVSQPNGARLMPFFKNA